MLLRWCVCGFVLPNAFEEVVVVTRLVWICVLWFGSAALLTQVQSEGYATQDVYKHFRARKRVQIDLRLCSIADTFRGLPVSFGSCLVSL
jgi:hypothetical protein